MARCWSSGTRYSTTGLEFGTSGFLIEGTAVRSFRFHHTVYSGQELKDRLHNVGFQEVRLFGDQDGNEYGVDATRLVAVAWK